MHVHSAIAQLRDPRDPQLRPATKATGVAGLCDGWLASEEAQSVKRDLDRYGDGAKLGDCVALARLLSDHRSACGFANTLVEGLIEGLRREALAEAPFRFQVSKGLATLRLIEAGNATMNLVAYEPLDTAGEPDTALFADRETHEIILSGEGAGWELERGEDGRVTTHPRYWRQGDTITTKPLSSARQIIEVKRSLLVLQLVRESNAPRPTCLVKLSSGEVLQTASGDKSASQAVMALAVLGALSADAARDVVRATALNRDEDVEVRWEAARQLLGLDTSAGLVVLSRLSQSVDDPLNSPAQNLRTQLLAAQPELAVAITETV